MAIKRQFNLLGNQRVDVPHLRLMETAVAADFQSLSGVFMAGSRALVGSGVILLDTGMVGQPADTLMLRMANAALLHGAATEPGGIYTVPSTQPDDILAAANAAVVGSFNPNSTNYIALGLLRTADATTQDTVIFRSTLTKLEFPQVVPLGRVLNYTINISTSNFGTTPTLCPVAKVVTDVNNNIVSIQDCRQMFFRLGSGGTAPNPLAQYVWANRNETALATLFGGGDKDITSQYDFNRAIEQRLWELGGGEHWYSPADDRSVKLVYTTASPWAWDGTDLTWTGLKFVFGNSTAQTNTVTDHAAASSGFTDLVDGEVIYVDLDRTVDGATLLSHKVSRTWLFANPPSIPGTRHILAWRVGAKVFAGEANNDVTVTVPLPIATNLVNGGVKLNHASGTPADPKVAVINASDWAVASGMDASTAVAMFFGTVTAASLTFAQAGVDSTFYGRALVSQGVVAWGMDSAVTATVAVYGQGGSGTAGVVPGKAGLDGRGGNGFGAGAGGPGVFGLGGTGSGGHGGEFYGSIGTGISHGVYAKGGWLNPGSGSGVVGVVGNIGGAGAYGVDGQGTGAAVDGTGVHGIGKGAGHGGYFEGGVGSGYAIYALGSGAAGIYGIGGATFAGVVGRGGTTGMGVYGIGGATAGAEGVRGLGGPNDGTGVKGLGVLTGFGGDFLGGATAAQGHGVKGQGGVGGAYGVLGYGTLGYEGVHGEVISGTGWGVKGVGKGDGLTGAGVAGYGGVASNGYGVYGVGVGTGTGVYGQGSGSGYGVEAAGNGTSAALHLAPGAQPSAAANGNIYYDIDEKASFFWDNSGWQQMGQHAFMRSSDVSTTSNVMASITGFSFPVVAGQKYAFEVNFIASTADAAGMSLQFTGPAIGAGAIQIGSVLVAGNIDVNGNAVTNADVGYASGNGTTAFSNPFPIIAHALGLASTFKIYGSLVMGATGGTVQLQWKSNTNLSSSTLKAGSYIKWQRMA